MTPPITVEDNTQNDAKAAVSELSALADHQQHPHNKNYSFHKYNNHKNHNNMLLAAGGGAGSNASLKSYHDEIGIHVLQDDSAATMERSSWRHRRNCWAGLVVIAITLVFGVTFLVGGSRYYRYQHYHLYLREGGGEVRENQDVDRGSSSLLLMQDDSTGATADLVAAATTVSPIIRHRASSGDVTSEKKNDDLPPFVRRRVLLERRSSSIDDFADIGPFL
mmetsp:Transcript_85031/g.127461  ORF Transcript_85031/g.127461 Transcript_85031/m.127461 type:complete len:221 (+) Transcript_85031:101-763(+)